MTDTTKPTYPKGSRWRVTKPGARIIGMKPDGPNCFTGYRLDLAVGTVLTSRGRSMTFGDGVYALKWGDATNQWICNDAIFEPNVGGMWGGQLPDPAYVEPAPADVPLPVHLIPDVIAEYDRMVRLNTTPDYDAIAEVIADDGFEVRYEVCEVAEGMGWLVDDDLGDKLHDAADVYQARLARERSK